MKTEQPPAFLHAECSRDRINTAVGALHDVLGATVVSWFLRRRIYRLINVLAKERNRVE